SANAEITSELDNFLLRQASQDANASTGIPNCDIVVFQYLSNSRKAWFLNRALVSGSSITRNDAVFTDDSDQNGTNDQKSLAYFIAQPRPNRTIPPTTSKPCLIVGLPVGMGERFAVDWDMDGKKNLDEPNAMFTIDPAPDSTPPVVQSSTLVYRSTNT